MALNSRKIAMAAVVGYLADFVFNMAFHGKFAMPAYTSTSELWRSHAEMANFSAFCTLGQLIFVSVAALVFARGYEKKGMIEGVRFGVVLGLLLVGKTLSSYVYLPIPASILNLWIISDLLEGALLGFSFALVFGMDLGEKKQAAKPVVKLVEKPAAKSAKPAAKKPKKK